jgi:type IV secretory pathway VirB2 component (pilin)
VVLVVAFVPTLHWLFENQDTYTPVVLNWITAKLGFEVARYLIVLWALAFGLVLYVLRCRWPRTYGVIEIVVGAYIATFLVNRLLGKTVELGPQGENGTVFFTIVGALYIIVRGLDNFHKARDGKTHRTILWDTGVFKRS